MSDLQKKSRTTTNEHEAGALKESLGNSMACCKNTRGVLTIANDLSKKNNPQFFAPDGKYDSQLEATANAEGALTKVANEMQHNTPISFDPGAKDLENQPGS
ncbi:MAG: hypothetical protein JXR42_00250 [Gammaproteobacteria bacterium]|nr:hypothetical protein [Gammaproteobacteria bacterium]